MGLSLIASPPAAAQQRAAQPGGGLDAGLMERALDTAAALDNLHTLIVARDGTALVERVFRGPGLDRPVNVKSASKIVISALVGMAIERGLIAGPEQPVAPFFQDRIPDGADPRIHDITVEHLLSMRAGLRRTSGPFYGEWVNSEDWVGYTLTRPFTDEPGGRMLYSTGNTHLLSALLTKVSGRSTLALARAWLGEPLGISIPPWPRDPQGIYFGGNNMLLSPRALLRIGELYRQAGRIDGRRILSEDWVEASWTPRELSPHTGHYYGYGWFIAEARGHAVFYAYGYGGQMLYVVPALRLTVVVTSDPTTAAGRTGYAAELHGLVADGIVPAAERRTPGVEVEATGGTSLQSLTPGNASSGRDRRGSALARGAIATVKGWASTPLAK